MSAQAALIGGQEPTGPSVNPSSYAVRSACPLIRPAPLPWSAFDCSSGM